MTGYFSDHAYVIIKFTDDVRGFRALALHSTSTRVNYREEREREGYVGIRQMESKRSIVIVSRVDLCGRLYDGLSI